MIKGRRRRRKKVKEVKKGEMIDFLISSIRRKKRRTQKSVSFL